MHYVDLSRVLNSSTLHNLNSNEIKIKVSEKVKSGMSRLRTQVNLVPLVVLKTDNLHQTKTMLFQNVRSLYLHIDDVRSDYNIQKADVNIFVESELCLLDRDDTYQLSEYTLYRNDCNQSNIRTCYGTAVYIKNDFNCTKIPYRYNFNNLEITVMVLSQQIPNIHVIGIYHSKTKVTILELIYALTHIHNSALIEPTIPTVLLGNFNIDLIQGNSE